MMKKKFTQLAVVSTLLASILTGCAGEGGSSSSAGGDTIKIGANLEFLAVLLLWNIHSRRDRPCC